MDLRELQACSNLSPYLLSLSLSELILFIRICRIAMKMVEISTVDLSTPPVHLPPSLLAITSDLIKHVRR